MTNKAQLKQSQNWSTWAFWSLVVLVNVNPKKIEMHKNSKIKNDKVPMIGQA